ncbi:MAG: hypothetical protein U0M42_06075 [Acutalibacteraceae bacterium]|nr:hypothetical protein [Acutalibacteraceae bacterium]
MKKLFAILLAVALMATMSVTAFAAESQTSTITVVMKDSGGDGWAEGAFGFASLSTDKLELEVASQYDVPKGITNAFILEDGTTATITHTVAKDEVVYFRWGGEGDEEASFNIYRDGILQYSCDDVTKFDGSVWELFFTSYPVEGTTITYTVNPTYTVTIPETVTIGTDGTEKTVSAEGVVVEKGKYVSVTLAENNNFTVKTTEGAELPYTVTANGEAVAAGGEILAVNPKDGKTGTANITFDIDESAIQYAGTYTGTATFTIAVKDAPETTINFTIDGATFEAEKGITWAEWVESAYNNGGFYSAYESVYWGEGFWFILCNYGKTPIDDDYYVNAADVIQANTDYVRVELSEG